MLRLLIALAVCGVLVGIAPGPQPAGVPAPHFLAPESFVVSPGKPFALALTGADNQAAQFDNQRVRWTYVRVAASQRNADSAALGAAGQPVATLDLPGVAVIGVDMQPDDIAVDPVMLKTFIAERGTAAPNVVVPGGAKLVRVRHIESFKTILRGGKRGEEAGQSEACGESTQRAEIQAVLDPTALTLPSDLMLRLSARSQELEDQKLIATHLPSGRTFTVDSREGGFATISLDAPGPWRLEFHALLTSADPDGPPLTLYSATLTFSAGPDQGAAQ